MNDVQTGTVAWRGLGLLTCCLIGAACSEDRSAKSWSALATCLAGSAAQAELPARMQHLRGVQLGSPQTPAAKDAWPERCMSYANELYQALPTSGKPAMLRRKLQEKLGCADDKASCTLANDEALLPATTELWQAAKDAELTIESPQGVPQPAGGPAPAVTLAQWKALSDKPQRLEGPWLSPDGRLRFLLKNSEGRGKPSACELGPGFEKLACSAAHADVPDLPLQTVRLIGEASAPFAAALTESGLLAYDLSTGKTSGVRGGAGALLVNGLAVEAQAEDAGFIAVEVKNGKAGKEHKLPVNAALNEPTSFRDHAIWLEQLEGGAKFVAKSVTGGRLRDAANLEGAFTGPFHTCEGEGIGAVATWERRSGIPGAKATAGSDKTRVTVTQLRAGTWSKPVEATLPFERLAESELHCTKSGVSLAWSSRVAGGLEIGRIDCTEAACKATTTELPGVDSKWWWLLSPLGDKVVMVWRAGLGETRLRIAPLAALASAPDKVVFDTSDFGGPDAKSATAFVTGEAALLLFQGEPPVAVRIGKDGAVGVITP
jgi:hypothetical protein